MEVGYWSSLPLDETMNQFSEVTGMFWQVWWLLLPPQGLVGGQCWNVYTQAPVPVGETSLQGPNCTLRILVLFIFKFD